MVRLTKHVIALERVFIDWENVLCLGLALESDCRRVTSASNAILRVADSNVYKEAFDTRDISSRHVARKVTNVAERRGIDETGAASSLPGRAELKKRSREADEPRRPRAHISRRMTTGKPSSIMRITPTTLVQHEKLSPESATHDRNVEGTARRLTVGRRPRQSHSVGAPEDR